MKVKDIFKSSKRKNEVVEVAEVEQQVTVTQAVEEVAFAEEQTSQQGKKFDIKAFFKRLLPKKKEKEPKKPKKKFSWKQLDPRRLKNVTKDDLKIFLMGNGEKRGFLMNFFGYSLLILFGFVYVYPILYMLGYSLMGEADVANPTVNYLPTKLFFSNYKEAWQVLDYLKSLFNTMYVSVLPSIMQTVACCLTAYGLARFKFPGKNLLFALILLTFIVPPQLTMLPQLLIYTNLKLIDTVFSYILPAVLGQGIKSAVFILIFYQFFKGIPESVIEAAKIDGANSFKIFWSIGIPSVVPAILLSFLLSVVWYYNETVLSSMYFGSTIKTLPGELEKFQATYTALFGQASSTGKSVNEAIYMAGTMLSILPLIVMYFFTQKYFVEGIDKAGVTGE